ncbi:MAG: penicillin-binding protein activator [Oxalobacteraceae bacterium]
MSYKWIKMLLLCSALAGCSSVSLDPIFNDCGAAHALCAPVAANTTAPVVSAGTASLPAADVLEPWPGVETSSVAVPAVAILRPEQLLPVRIALLLPLRSETLGAAAEAVRAGFMAAHARDQQGATVSVIDTGDAAPQILSAYLEAQPGHDLIVGPLSRSGVSAVAQSGAVRVPTIALNQPMLATQDEIAAQLPPRMLAMGLAVEDEARQVARWASQEHPGARAFVVGANIAWQRRVSAAFSAEWKRLGLSSQSVELGITEGYLNANDLAHLRTRLQNAQPALLLVSMDAGLGRQLRQAIGTGIPVYGTSQLNPLVRADNADSQVDPLLEDLHLVDMPWLLQPDHPAVMAYPRLVNVADQQDNPDLERLYALGIDAYRVAREIAGAHEQFNIDGVTGRLAVAFGQGRASFERIVPQAVYQDGAMLLLPGTR